MSLNIEKSCGNYITGFSNYSTERISNMKKIEFVFLQLVQMRGGAIRDD